MRIEGRDWVRKEETEKERKKGRENREGERGREGGKEIRFGGTHS